MMRRTILLSLLLSALCFLAGASAARAQGGDHRAGLVIRFGDGSVQTQCVSFGESSITGEELLQRSGLPRSHEPQPRFRRGRLQHRRRRVALSPRRIVSAAARA